MTVVDAGVVIGWLSPLDPHHRSSTAAMLQAVDERAEIVLPAPALAEVLAGVWPLGATAVGAFRKALDRVPITVEPFTDARAVLAGQVRASSKPALKLPDAMVVATAVDLAAERLVTTDRRWGDLGRVGFGGRLDVL